MVSTLYTSSTSELVGTNLLYKLDFVASVVVKENYQLKVNFTMAAKIK